MSEHKYPAITASFPAPTATLWSLLVNMQARALWQPSVTGAELLIGEENSAGSEYALNCENPFVPALLIERVLLCEPPAALQTVRHLPQLDCHSDYRVITTDTHHCQLQMRRTLQSAAATKAINPNFDEIVALYDTKDELDALATTVDNLIQRLSKTGN